MCIFISMILLSLAMFYNVINLYIIFISENRIVIRNIILRVQNKTCRNLIFGVCDLLWDRVPTLVLKMF